MPIRAAGPRQMPCENAKTTASTDRPEPATRPAETPSPPDQATENCSRGPDSATSRIPLPPQANSTAHATTNPASPAKDKSPWTVVVAFEPAIRYRFSDFGVKYVPRGEKRRNSRRLAKPVQGKYFPRNDHGFDDNHVRGRTRDVTCRPRTYHPRLSEWQPGPDKLPRKMLLFDTPLTSCRAADFWRDIDSSFVMRSQVSPLV